MKDKDSTQHKHTPLLCCNSQGTHFNTQNTKALSIEINIPLLGAGSIW